MTEGKLKSFEDLDDYTIMTIFDYFTLKELIVIERVSKKWRDLSLKSWNSRKKIRLNDMGVKFPMRRLEEVLKRATNVTHLDMQGKWGLTLCGINYEIHIPDIPMKNKFLLINKYCKNLKQLKISINRESGVDFDSLDDSVVKKLTYLSIRFEMNISYKNFNTKLSLLLERANDLEEFDILSSYQCYKIENHVLLKISDKCRKLKFLECHVVEKETFSMVLERLPDLEKLCLGSIKFTFASLSKVSNKLVSSSMQNLYNKFSEVENNYLKNLTFQNLRVLELIQNECADNAFVSLFISKCPLLEEINLHSCEEVTNQGFKELSKLGNLRIITVNYTNIGDTCLAYLGKTLKNLEKVHCWACKNVTAMGIIKLIRFSQNLKYLGIDPFEKEFMSTFFRTALTSVESRPNKVSLSIDVHVNEEDVTELGLSRRNNRSLKYNYVKIVGNTETFFKMDVPKFKVYYVDWNPKFKVDCVDWNVLIAETDEGSESDWNDFDDDL